MTDTLEHTAQRIADRGRDALLARLRPAFADAASAHAEILQLDDDQLEQMVQRAADRADGLQWRRALASVAIDELGIGLGEALGHPAVERAQAIVGAPSYEDSLASLEARDDAPAIEDLRPQHARSAAGPAPARPAGPAPARPAGPAPGRPEIASSEPQEEPETAPQARRQPQPTKLDVPVQPVLAKPEPAVRAATPSLGQPSPAQTPLSQPRSADARPTQTRPASKPPAPSRPVHDDPLKPVRPPQRTQVRPAATPARPAAQRPVGAQPAAPPPVGDQPAAPPPVGAQPAARPPVGAQPPATPGAEAEPPTRPATAAAAEAQLRAAKAPPAGSQQRPAPTTAGPAPTAVTPAPTAVTPAPTAATPAPTAATPAPTAATPAPTAARPAAAAAGPATVVPAAPGTPEPDTLRVAAVHLGGVTNLRPGESAIELRLSEQGLDIARESGQIIGRLGWDEIDGLEVPPARGLLKRRRTPRAHLVVRAGHGDASFEIPAIYPDELREHLDPLLARHGLG